MKLLVGILVLIPLASTAELGPELQYLAETPVSRLEYALERWQADAQEWLSFQEGIGASWAQIATVAIGLNPDAGTIEFWGILGGAAANPGLRCAEFVAAVKERFGGHLYGNPLERYFGHRFIDPDPPTEDMRGAIGRVTNVICQSGGHVERRVLVE